MLNRLASNRIDIDPSTDSWSSVTLRSPDRAFLIISWPDLCLRTGDPSDTSAAMRGQDIADLIAWLINDMPTDVSPAVILVDGANIGMTGTSQGGINTWYSGLVAGGVKAIAPRNFAMHAWSRGFLNNGSFIRNIAGFSNVSPLVITHDTASLEAGLASDDPPKSQAQRRHGRFTPRSCHEAPCQLT